MILQSINVSLFHSTFCETTQCLYHPKASCWVIQQVFLKKSFLENRKPKSLRIPVPHLPSKRSQGNKFSGGALIVGGNGDPLDHSVEVWDWCNTKGTPIALSTKGWEKQMTLGLVTWSQQVRLRTKDPKGSLDLKKRRGNFDRLKEM